MLCTQQNKQINHFSIDLPLRDVLFRLPFTIFSIPVLFFKIRHNLLLVRLSKLFCYQRKAFVYFWIMNIHENYGIMNLLLTIEKLVHGGLGLARTDRGVVLVSDVAPGEKVRAIPDGARGGQPCA